MRNNLLNKRAALALTAVALAVSAGSPAAGEGPTKSATAGTSASPKGMFLQREEPGEKWTPGTAWTVVGDKAPLPAGVLLVGLPGAEFDSANGAVRVRMLTDFDSPQPVLEPAVLLYPAGDKDLDLTLDRGMIELVSAKKKGAATARVRVRGAQFDLTLYTAGTRVSLLLGSGWAKGVPFKKDPGPNDVPSAELIVVVQKGEADIHHDGKLFALEAPPGPATIQWSNRLGMDATPTRLEKLPDWILPPTDLAEKEKERLLRESVADFCKAVADKPLDAVLDEFVNSDNPAHRRFAVVLLGATDKLSGLAVVLNSAKHLDIWDATVKVLRHWIGRGPGQDQVLYKRLIELRNYKPAEAGTVLHFLHTPADEEMARPETYEMLIDYLNSDRLAVRGLAFWHLYRLVPSGRVISYDPLAAPAERARARAEWKKLIPDGKLPPSSKEQEKKP
jgi:hypothetical protein